MSQKHNRTKETWARTCPECDTEFRSERVDKKFCSDICRVRAWQKRFPRIDPTTGLPKQAKHTQER